MDWDHVHEWLVVADCNTWQCLEMLDEIIEASPDGSWDNLDNSSTLAAAIIHAVHDDKTRREAIESLDYDRYIRIRNNGVSRYKKHIQSRIGMKRFDEAKP